MSEYSINQGEAIADGPDWEGIGYDVFCPLCEYNLRGLNQPRCPECGYRFEWPEVLDPRRKKHPYLFEHHPERHIRSYWQTAVGSWRPSLFWTSLHPTQPSRPYRLVLYWCLGMGVYLLGIAAHFGVITVWVINNPGIGIRIPSYGSWVAHYFIIILRTIDYLLGGYRLTSPGGEYIRTGASYFWSSLAKPALVPLIWPWLVFVVLMIFQFSMRRAKVKPMHVLRCALYSFDLLFWLGVILVLTAIVPWLCTGSIKMNVQLIYSLNDIGFLFAVIGSWRLWKAYKQYLRFSHPLGTVVVSQIIVIQLIFYIIFALPRSLW
ncbi:MAG: hypothetical protein ACYTF1_12580 [Planctomycetota bacterium]|jgi:hypothetical protein